MEFEPHLLHLCYMCGVMMVILQFKSKQAASIKVYRQSCRLQKIIRNTTMRDHYYVCHMTETFEIDGKRMYNSVPFSTGSLFPHMDPGRGELPITTGDGTTAVTSRFIKGVDKRATITTGWSNFFRQAHMK
ncbi:uncharacterized protein LOC123404120 [Hordeum vulgare subsp. vulgare]|uniref:uncharacterized protein LOC123404120 n=1 Tax=Hordeum vulgare subsp. vulgare TaxID=112509 RepID=UPI001D1A5143|nr:uncharacterized protein LOC123404120 [Hordeum vulgare subsp. vulgare]